MAPPNAKISIHALLAESDKKISGLWREQKYFYPRSPCGERPKSMARAIAIMGISIHALLAESDRFGFSTTSSISDFYPRSPCGERPMLPVYPSMDTYFYPRSPCGERRRDGIRQLHGQRFLSTLSLRRATAVIELASYILSVISIHALLAESDLAGGAAKIFDEIFLSTLSLRRATAFCHSKRTAQSHFYPRSPCGERLGVSIG